MGDLTMNHIIPVATHYQSMLLKNVQSMRAVFPAEKAEKLSSRNMKIIEDIAERTQAIEQGVEELVNALKVANRSARRPSPTTTRSCRRWRPSATTSTNWSSASATSSGRSRSIASSSSSGNARAQLYFFRLFSQAWQDPAACPITLREPSRPFFVLARYLQ